MQLTSIKIHWSYSLVIASSTATSCSATKCAKSSNESGLDNANKIPEPRHTVATLSTPFTNGWVTTACSFSSTRNTQYLQDTGTQWHKRAPMGSNGHSFFIALVRTAGHSNPNCFLFKHLSHPIFSHCPKTISNAQFATKAQHDWCGDHQIWNNSPRETISSGHAKVWSGWWRMQALQ